MCGKLLGEQFSDVNMIYSKQNDVYFWCLCSQRKGILWMVIHLYEKK